MYYGKSCSIGLDPISRLQESRAGLPLYSSHVYVVMPKAGGGFSICGSRPLIITMEHFILDISELFF